MFFYVLTEVQMAAKRNIKIYINSVRYEVGISLFDDTAEDYDDSKQENSEPERTQIKSHGTFEIDGDIAKIYYDETELTGLEGSQTVISFNMREPDAVTMMRTGAVSTTLVFEKGRRHHCSYRTQYMLFEVCVNTMSVKNTLDANGCLELDYIVEIRGARAERNKFSMRIGGDR